MTEENVYHAAGYGQRDVGFGKKPALLLVDFQNAFTKEEYPTGKQPMIRKAAEETASLLQLAREQEIPVIYTVVSYRENNWDIGNWKTDISWITPFSDAAKVSSAVEPLQDEPIVTKKFPSAFFGTEVASLLNIKNVDTVIITGCTTSGCVRASIIDSFSHGFKTIVPRECVGDQSERQSESNLFDVNARYADVVSKEKVENYLRSIHNEQFSTN